MPDQISPSTIDLARVRRVVLMVILLVTVSIIAVWLLYALRMVLLLLAFTVIFCYLIAPVVDVVEQPLRFGNSSRKLPRSLAISIVYLLLIGGIILLADRVAPLLSDQLAAFADNFPSYAQQLDQYAKSLEKLPSRYRLPQGWRQALSDWITTTQQGAVEWLKSMVGRTVRLALFLPWLILIPVIGFFFLKDAKAVSTRFLASLPQADMRYRLTVFLREVSETLAAYIRAQLIACAVVGVIEGSGLWLLGISYPLVFAIAAAILEFVPVVGPLALGCAATLVASFHSTESAFTVASFLLVFRIIHDYAIYPRLIGAGVEIHPVAVILAVICGVELGGVTGVFLSVPVAALLIVCWRHWRNLTTTRNTKLEKPSHDFSEIE